MERKEFIKRIGMNLVALPLLSACSKDDDPTTNLTDTDTGENNNGGCLKTPSETAGPFPTKNPATLTITDIKSDRTGVPMMLNITIKNKNKDCAVLEGAVVDIWHCDKDGNYSEYGGTGMQQQNYTSAHFLRGRQSTNAAGVAGFSSIFPGWYSGRAPHIHVQVFNSSGKSLLVTQIAFPKTVCDTVYSDSSFYSSRGKADTTNERDNVFSDGFEEEMGLVSGSLASGYSLTHTIVVEG